MLYTEMNINQKVNFKSWRMSEGPKLSRQDYFPDDEWEFWHNLGRCIEEPLVPDLGRNLFYRAWRRNARH